MEQEVKGQSPDKSNNQVMNADPKPQRACKGKKYKELVEQGGIRKERKSSKGSTDSGEEKSPVQTQPMPMEGIMRTEESRLSQMSPGPKTVTFSSAIESSIPDTQAPTTMPVSDMSMPAPLSTNVLTAAGDGKPPESPRKAKIKPPPLPAHVLQSAASIQSPSSTNSPRRVTFKKSVQDGMEKVLDKVDFDRRFEQLPEFRPESADMSSPLPQSPRAIISNYRKRGSRKV